MAWQKVPKQDHLRIPILLLMFGLVFMAPGCPSDAPDCDTDEDCPLGRYCQAEACAFDCTYDAECPDQFRCTPRGRCDRGCRETNDGIEACDGIDNNCDEQTDEDWPDLGLACQNDGCPAGRWVCSADGLSAICDGPQAQLDDDSCDGIDDDCDDQTDEDAGDRACPLQAGVCAGAMSTCQAVGGYSECDYGPEYVEGLDDTCDQADDDCDGQTDEDALLIYLPEAGAQAADGIDNNCNGLVDEAGGIMVPVAQGEGVWIDAYEIGVFDNPDCAGEPLGASNDDYPAGWPPEEAPVTETLYACSLPGIFPSGHLSWYRAKRACEAIGKRLCTRENWAQTCFGDGIRTYPYGAVFVPGLCNDAWGGLGQVAPTGSHPGCVSQTGAYDMTGNLTEWLADWDDVPTNALVGGYGYVCEICYNGGDCLPCEAFENGFHEVKVLSDCVLEARASESFFRTDPRFYFGTRCCLDGP